MSDQSQAGRAVNGNTGQSSTLLFNPALTSSVCGPFIAGALKANAQAQEAFGMIAGEWQAFVGHRLQEDMALVQRLAKSQTPEQILAAYSEFWQKAAEDYGKKFAAMTKLIGRVTSKVAQTSQAATDEAGGGKWHWQRAAA
jgi:Phasin protein